jgi:hypothetical protein
MSTRAITLHLPNSLYTHLEQTARAAKRSLNDILLQTIKVGSPPRWDDVSAEFQPDLAALHHLDDGTLWKIARSYQREKEMAHYYMLLDKNASDSLSANERQELDSLRTEADRFMLRKAHAAALLKWRGNFVPPAKKL